MQISLEAVIAALIRLGALVYAGIGLVGVVTMMVTLATVSGGPGLSSGMMGPIVGVLVVPIVVGTVAFLCSLSIARFVCSGLGEVSE